jgi:hypothetical protein
VQVGAGGVHMDKRGMGRRRQLSVWVNEVLVSAGVGAGVGAGSMRVSAGRCRSVRVHVGR